MVFQGALLLPRGFCFWCWVKSNSQQIECTICTESKLASSCAALLLCSRCQLISMSLEENKQSIKCRYLGDSIKFIVLSSPQKSGEPNLRLFQPYLSRRQTSLSQPCSRLTGVVFHGAPLLPRGFCFWWWVKNNSQQIECTICTESKLASSAFIIRFPCLANFCS